MKLTDAENFEISILPGTSGRMDDFNKSVRDYFEELVNSVDINDQYGKVLTLRLSGGKFINVTAANDVSMQILGPAFNHITKNMIGKSLKDVLEHDYGNASRINY